MKREFLTGLAVIGSVIAVILSAPLIYHFTYPTQGDDGARYLIALQNGEPIHNYGIYLLKPLMWSGLSALPALSLLYYLLISVSVIMVYLTARQYGLKTAIIATPFTMLANWGIWKLWFDGSILGMGGLLIFNFGAYLSLSKMEKNGNPFWLLIFMLFLVGGTAFHKVTGLYILITVLAYAIVKRNIPTGIVAAFVALFGMVIWQNNGDSINSVFTSLHWYNYLIITYYWLFMGFIWWHYRRVFESWSSLTQLLIILMVVISTGLFINNPYQYRLVLDLTTVGFVFLSVAIGRGLIYLPQRYQSLALLLILAIPAMSLNDKWTTNYSAIRIEDVKTIDYINNLPGHKVVAYTSGESPWILRLYFNNSVTLTSDADYADILVTRQLRIPYNEARGFITDYKLKTVAYPYRLLEQSGTMAIYRRQ